MLSLYQGSGSGQPLVGFERDLLVLIAVVFLVVLFAGLAQILGDR